MSENLETLNEPIQGEQEYEFELPPLFAGMIAKEYQCGSTTTGLPMRGWGASERTTTVRHQGRGFIAVPYRRKGVPGLRIQIDDDVTGTRKTYWCPWSALDTITVILKGLIEVD